MYRLGSGPVFFSFQWEMWSSSAASALPVFPFYSVMCEKHTNTIGSLYNQEEPGAADVHAGQWRVLFIWVNWWFWIMISADGIHDLLQVHCTDVCIWASCAMWINQRLLIGQMASHGLSSGDVSSCWSRWGACAKKRNIFNALLCFNGAVWVRL